jgi:putative copper export protein
LVSRFSRFALLASAIVLFSGLMQASLEVGSWPALLETAYGQLVLIKASLLVAMLLLASFNTWRGRMRSASAGAVGTQLYLVRRGIRAELTLGVVALATAAVLGGTPPAPYS